jgi:HSP20 family protein
MTLFFPRFQQEFSPLFRLADEIDRATRSGGCSPAAARAQRSSVFLPRFDVKDTKEAYKLTGELPGVDQSNVSIVWADEKTLVISGSTETETTETNEPQQAADDATITSETSPAHYQKPSVEEDGQDFVDVEKPESEEQQSEEKPQEAAPAAQKPETDGGRYLFTERASGSFKRVFKFPGHVDHDNVTASLKNGVLAITAPKAKPVEPRKIVIS